MSLNEICKMTHIIFVAVTNMATLKSVSDLSPTAMLLIKRTLKEFLGTVRLVPDAGLHLRAFEGPTR